MPNYRRCHQPGGTFFLTIVTEGRRHHFDNENAVETLRGSLRIVQDELPFEIVAAVILPDHMHFLWTLPPEDSNYPKRIGRMKVEFTKSTEGAGFAVSPRSRSKIHKRESDNWQRRYWEHTIVDEDDLKNHLDYIHYNPVKHGYVARPSDWKWSSFSRWVNRGVYEVDWGSGLSSVQLARFAAIADLAGE